MVVVGLLVGAVAVAPADAIVGGTTATYTKGGSQSWVLLLRFKDPTPDDPNHLSRCTGVALSASTVATAAHCLEGRTAADFNAPFTGVYAGKNTSALTRYGVASLWRDPGYDTFSSDQALQTVHDYGVLFLSSPMPSTVVMPAKVSLAGPTKSTTASTFTFAGWGSTTSSGPGSSTLQMASFVLQAPPTTDVSNTPSSQNDGYLKMSSSTADPCFGDSGAPWFRDGLVVAVDSGSLSASCSAGAIEQGAPLGLQDGDFSLPLNQRAGYVIAAGQHLYNVWDVTAGNIDLQPKDSTHPVAFIDLQGTGTVNNIGTVKQTVHGLIPGRVYTLSLKYATDPPCIFGPRSASISMDAASTTISTTSTDWQTLTLSVRAKGFGDVLTMQSQGEGATEDCGLHVANVTLT